jgi:hypothetical protein
MLKKLPTRLNIKNKELPPSGVLISFLPSLELLATTTNKTDRHDITEILLKVALNTINQNQTKTSIRSK